MSETIRITIDRSGRVLIPKAIRTRLGLSPGTTLMVEEHDNKEILLRPLREGPRLIDKGGVLVVQSQAVGEIANAERREREVRVSELLRRIGL